MLGNIQINIPIDLGIIQSKNQSSLKNKEDGTKNVDSNSIDSITTTSIVYLHLIINVCINFLNNR